MTISQYERLTPENCAMILLDHQTGLMLGVNDFNAAEYKNNVLALAKIAKIYNLPTVITASFADGPNGPLLPELVELFPDTKIIYRPGQINAWDHPDFVAAVKATKRKKLIMAAISTDVCLAFPALSANAEGYEVYAVIDASGTWSPTIQNIAINRMSQAGVVMMNWVAVAAELQADWRKSTGDALAKLFLEHLTFYGHLIRNFNAKQTQK